jgi:hypothetical protein
LQAQNTGWPQLSVMLPHATPARAHACAALSEQTHVPPELQM